MGINDLDTSIKEAQRFIKKAMDAKKRIKEDKYALITGSKETGAVKRAALDLKMELSNITRQQ